MNQTAFLRRWLRPVVLAAWVWAVAGAGLALAQVPLAHHGEVLPRDVREMYDRGLQYLAKTQSEQGNWPEGMHGAGTTGLSLMVFLASGEDPNFGRYRNQVRRALRSILSSQDSHTGFLSGNDGHSIMYQHGFAMLALAEAYGAVDERDLWRAGEGSHPSIGAALELAVRAAVTSQKKNPLGAWRYSPDGRDADTSVSGAVLVGLLAARNAGIEVPDASIDKAIAYYQSMTSNTGQVAYSGVGGYDDSLARVSIASLVYSLARRRDLPQYQATLKFLTERLDQQPSMWPEYARYYQAQALFQGNVEAWDKWNKLLIRQLKASQQEDGSFSGDMGQSFSTSMSLLALALNYRLLPIYER